jgi:hypothetical protein
MNNHKTTFSTDPCILELRARVAKLEAHASNYPAIPDSSTPPPVATDEELRDIWDRAFDLRAIYNLGIKHGQASSQKVAKPAPVAGGLVDHLSWLIAEFASRSKPGDDCKPAAVKIVAEVAGWLRKLGAECSAGLLEHEAGR